MGESLSLGPRITGDHHYALLEHVLPMCTGVAVEFGTGAGESTALIAAHMPVISFGSINGLPEDWRDGEYPAGSFAHPLPVIDNATLVEGLFTDTLPSIDFSALDIGLCHFDADLYSSTATALEHVGPHLRSGTIVVFDEYHSFSGFQQCELRAWAEWTKRTGIDYTPIGHDFEQAAFRCA